MKTNIIILIILFGYGLFALYSQESESIKEMTEMLEEYPIAESAKMRIMNDYRTLKQVPESAFVNKSIDFNEKLLKRYLDLKTVSLKGQKIEMKDLRDIRGVYLAGDADLLSVKINIPQKYRIEKVETGGRTLEYNSIEFSNIKPLIIPVIDSETSIYVSNSDGETNILSIINNMKQEMITFSGPFTEASEVYVNTDPKGAEVFFNGKKYYRPTNIKSSRKPGKTRIEIKKNGYKTYTKETELSPGEKLIIKRKLEKK